MLLTSRERCAFCLFTRIIVVMFTKLMSVLQYPIQKTWTDGHHAINIFMHQPATLEGGFPCFYDVLLEASCFMQNPEKRMCCLVLIFYQVILSLRKLLLHAAHFRICNQPLIKNIAIFSNLKLKVFINNLLVKYQLKNEQLGRTLVQV